LIDTLNLPFQIIGLTETWLNENNIDCFNLENYEYLCSNRTTKRGGGVGLYILKQLEFKSRDDLTKNIENIIETKLTEITNNNGKNFIIGVIYRPPNSNFETFKNTLNTILEKIDKENKICYLMGDFNINLFKSESCDYAN
jgi:exonuclease III